ncbi:MAG: DNA translocase FtsK [Kiritimatiellae bacterium]|nr:DNA translocase FtsK [Kiritimatiellia bacterium]
MRQPDNASGNESSLRRRLIGFFMFPIALFPLLALVSYNWRCVAALRTPPLPTENLIGVVGDWFAYNGYQILGLGVWAVPLICAFCGFRLVLGRSFHPGRRTLGVALFVLAVTCLLQLLGMGSTIHPLLMSLNIAPNAGGAVGYLVMTRCLARLLSPFGSSVLMASLAIFAILLTIGFRNIISGIGFLTAWAADRRQAMSDAEKDEALAAAQAARDAARAERLAEKERIAAEKAAEKAAREAEKEQRRREREAAQAAKDAERQAKLDAQRRMQEAAARDFFPAREDIPPAARPQPAAPPPQAPARSQPAPQRPSAPAKPVSANRPDQEPLQAAVVTEPEDKGPYVLPPATLLNEVPPRQGGPGENIEAMAQRLVDTLKVFDISATLAYYVAGPVVTQYALSLDLGTRVERVAGLARNLQMTLQAKSLRIEAPIPGKNAVGIEVPNAFPASVCFREIIDGELWRKNAPSKFQLPILLGKDAAGNDLVADLAKLPHLLVAGATGQGKSVCLNSIINGLLMCRTPEQLKFIMVDPKRVEFTSYNALPHLLVPVINDTKKVMFGLRWAVVEMEKRLKMFQRAKCRNIVDFNSRKTVTQPDLLGGEETTVGGNPDLPRTIPYIVIIIDEVADIMQAAQKEVDPLIARLTALARAAGIHLVLATQRPDAKVITGTIKSNIPGRVAFKTSSAIDSRTILDAQGAEQLIGKGDMLFKLSDGRLLRAQGAYIADDEIERILSFIGEHSNTQFDETLTKRLEKIKEADPADVLDGDDGEEQGESDEPLAAASANGVPAPAGMTQNKEDQLYRRALEVLQATKRASTSHLQRRMGIGYNHAARLIDLLEERGVIGPARGAGPREILLDPETLLAGGTFPDASADGEGVPAHPDSQYPSDPGDRPVSGAIQAPEDDDPFGATL